MLSKNYKFGDSPSSYSKRVKDSGTLDSSQNNPTMEQQTTQLRPLKKSMTLMLRYGRQK